MENRLMFELLAKQKYEEDLRLAEKRRILQETGDSSPSIWKRLAGWVGATQQRGRKPARA